MTHTTPDPHTADDPNTLHAKWAFTTRRVVRDDFHSMLPDVSAAKAGDLLYARVVSLGQHDAIRVASARQARLYLGDLVVVAVGARYAPDQFEARAEIARGGCDLIAAGGLAGYVVGRHASMKAPTRLAPLGLLADARLVPLNLSRYRVPRALSGLRPRVTAVVGTSMNAGKTTAMACFINGLSNAGYRVGAAKITGTGAPKDLFEYIDAGAVCAVDFTDAGFATTFGATATEVEDIATSLVAHLAAQECDHVVVEIADGLLQQETRALLVSTFFRQFADKVLFAAVDALGAIQGAQFLRAQGLPLLAVTGCMTSSPLAAREAEAEMDVPVVPTFALQRRETIAQLLGELPAPTADCGASPLLAA